MNEPSWWNDAIRNSAPNLVHARMMAARDVPTDHAIAEFHILAGVAPWDDQVAATYIGAWDADAQTITDGMYSRDEINDAVSRYHRKRVAR